jgi:hypothetical protein
MTMDPLKQTCGAVVAACDRAAHAAECPNVQAKCPHHGCPSRPFRKNMTGHVAKCEHRRTKCRDCGEVRGGGGHGDTHTRLDRGTCVVLAPTRAAFV